jgi:hypothetical protein
MLFMVAEPHICSLFDYSVKKGTLDALRRQHLVRDGPIRNIAVIHIMSG